MARLKLEHLTKTFGAATVLNDVSLDVGDGEFLVLVGPSGCGKSTLLRIIAGLEAPTRGRCILDGVDVTDRDPTQRDVAMVFQNYALYPHMTVRKNLEFPLRLRKFSTSERGRKVDEVAEILGLAPLLDRKPGTLSGGQMQRVALGRAIIRNPRLFLFDEPLSNLDAKMRSEMRSEIARLHRRLGVTTIYVTHDQAEAMTMGSRIVVMQKGSVQQAGAPLAVFDDPANTFVASFIGSPPMNLVPGEVEGGVFRAGPLAVPCPHGAQGAVILGIRPHAFLDSGSTSAPATYVENLGTQTVIEVDLGGSRLLVTRDGNRAVTPGDPVRLGIDPATVRWFDVRTGNRAWPPISEAAPSQEASGCA